jgi:hypothetical protein
MKTIPRLFGGLCASLFCIQQAQAAAAATNESGVQLTIELRDGSRVVGKSVEDTLGFHSAALGDMKLPWTGIRSIEYAGTNTSAARLTATNGDAFAITLAAESVRVETGFGQTELPVKLIRSVKVAPPATAAVAAGTGAAQLAIELRDGSHVVGKGLDDALNFHSSAMGDLKLTWAGIRSLEYAGTNTEMARLTAANGDVYEVQFAVPALRVETSFGKSELPVKLIRSVRVAATSYGEMGSSLVAQWLGDGNAKDSAGHFDGQVSGGVSYVPGPAGQAFQFNGGESRVDFGSSAGNFGTNDFTIAYWMKTESKDPWDAFLSKRTSCDGGGNFWEIRNGGAGTPFAAPKLCLSDPAHQPAFYLYTGHAMNDGQWHHLAWVRQSNGSGGCMGSVYVDGFLVNSLSIPAALDVSNQTPLVLGQDVCQNRDGTRPYPGAAADLRIYSQALSAEDILAICQEGRR